MDILIIHLETFMMDKWSRNKINTLVTFLIHGFDIGEYVLSKDGKTWAIYDLYAVCNHEGGMDGGSFTAAVKNMDNKQW